MTQSLRVVFAGTPEFAAAALAAIHAAGFSVPLVLTQPDRPAGRGLKLTASPVKRFALERRVPEEHIDAPAGSLRHHVAFMFGPYLKTWTFWAEIAVTLFALYLLLFVHQIG